MCDANSMALGPLGEHAPLNVPFVPMHVWQAAMKPKPKPKPKPRPGC
jgi:hypothetical protein